MSKVSIIMPAFNRADTIMRAVRSVQAQTYGDWELIVVDDGSTDNTVAIIEGVEPRMRIIRQGNAGMTAARNTAIRAATGEYLAFLDSDDEFQPFHLELCVAFLDAHPDELSISTENHEDFGQGRRVNHYRVEVGDWYPRKAAIVGSQRLDLPPGETDDYLRVYETRKPIGEWGRAVIQRVAPDEEVFLYRGEIADYLPYDYLIAVTASLFRASAFEVLGLPEAQWATGSDFHWLTKLCRLAPTSFISIGTSIKHEFAVNGELPQCGHIVTGKSAMKFVTDWNRTWDDLFWNARSHDQELRGLRALRQLWGAETALRAGERGLALEYLELARTGLPHYLKVQALYWLVRCTPTAAMARRAFRALFKVMKTRLA